MYTKWLSVYCKHLQAIYLLLCSIGAGLTVFQRSTQPMCSSFSIYTWYLCNTGAARHLLAQDTLILTLLLPIVYASVFREVKWSIICLSWCITIIMIIISLLYNSLYLTFTTLFFYIPLSGLILYGLQRQYLQSFFLTECLLATAQVTEVQAINFAGEFRGLMGTRMYVCMYVCMHVCMYVMYVCI